MNRTLRLVALVAIPLFAAACAAESHDNDGDQEHANDSDRVALAGSDMLGYLEAKIDIADDKFMQLAEVIPEESYDWRPMEGVRSFREVFLHVAADNWYGGALMGIATPADIGVTGESESVAAYQDQVLSKAETLDHLRRSFDYFHSALDETRDHLETPAMLGSTELDFGDLWVRLVTHMHEHLGQTIAYTRSNHIVPPWSN